jgi:hypothetical protein
MKPHKHAELIKAWADGAVIQIRLFKSNGEVTEWEDCDPCWGDDAEYRIKPEEKKPVVRWLWAKQSNEDWLISPVFRSDEEALKFLNGKCICLEWSRQEFPE